MITFVRGWNVRFTSLANINPNKHVRDENERVQCDHSLRRMLYLHNRINGLKRNSSIEWLLLQAVSVPLLLVLFSSKTDSVIVFKINYNLHWMYAHANNWIILAWWETISGVTQNKVKNCSWIMQINRGVRGNIIHVWILFENFKKKRKKNFC